jgi:hypothetical protein
VRHTFPATSNTMTFEFPEFALHLDHVVFHHIRIALYDMTTRQAPRDVVSGV